MNNDDDENFSLNPKLKRKILKTILAHNFGRSVIILGSSVSLVGLCKRYKNDENYCRNKFFQNANLRVEMRTAIILTQIFT